MKLDDIYNKTDKLYLMIEAENIDYMICNLDILSMLVNYKLEAKKKYLDNESEKLRKKLDDYLTKYYKKFKIQINEIIDNKKFLDEFLIEKAEVEEKAKEIDEYNELIKKIDDMVIWLFNNKDNDKIELYHQKFEEMMCRSDVLIREIEEVLKRKMTKYEKMEGL